MAFGGSNWVGNSGDGLEAMKASVSLSEASLCANMMQFKSASDAWFQTFAEINRPGERSRVVLKCLDRLYRNRRLTTGHAFTLRRWGSRRQQPSNRDIGDFRLWNEAMSALGESLRSIGLLNGF